MSPFYRVWGKRGFHNCTQGQGIRRESGRVSNRYTGGPEGVRTCRRESGRSPCQRESRGSPDVSEGVRRESVLEGVWRESGGSPDMSEGVRRESVSEGIRIESGGSPEVLFKCFNGFKFLFKFI